MLHFVRNPSLEKLESLLGYLGQSGIADVRVTAVLLLIADGLHMKRHGRTLYGEAWYRDASTPGYVARGFLLDAVYRHLRRTDRLSKFDADAVSVTDLKALDEATATMTSLGIALHGEDARRQPPEQLRQAACMSPLWTEGGEGEPLDILACIAAQGDQNRMDDCHTLARYCAY